MITNNFSRRHNGPYGEEVKQMLEKIDTEPGHRIYPQRLAIVDPVFANIRSNKRLDRFTFRGKIKVHIQWLMYCLIHNIEKIRTMGWPRRKTEEERVQEELLCSGNARNRKIVKILALKCLGGDHDKLKVVF